MTTVVENRSTCAKRWLSLQAPGGYKEYRREEKGLESRQEGMVGGGEDGSEER